MPKPETHEMTVKLETDPYTFRTSFQGRTGYPWYKLQKEGDTLNMEGNFPRASATKMAYAFAKTHGFRVSVISTVEGIRVIRRDKGTPPVFKPGQHLVRYPFHALAVRGSCIIEWDGKKDYEQQAQARRIMSAITMHARRSGNVYSWEFKGVGLKVTRNK